MIRVSTVLSAFILVALSIQAKAQNRDDADSMFPEKTSSTMVQQAVIGFGEYLIFNALHAKDLGLTPLSKQLNDRDSKIIDQVKELLNDPNLDAKERALLQKKLFDAEQEITARNVSVLMNSEAALKRSKMIQKILFTGQALTVVDMFGRVYVWHKLDRDPTVSPTATYVLQLLKK